jgi:hypothetical protein
MAAVFEEVGRTALGDKTELVASKVVDGGQLKGISLNRWIDTPTFTGFGKGFLVPVERYADVLEMLTKALRA